MEHCFKLHLLTNHKPYTSKMTFDPKLKVIFTAVSFCLNPVVFHEPV